MADITVSHNDNFRFVSDKSVDFVLTDPPFNISKETNFHTYEKNSIHSYKFDEKTKNLGIHIHTKSSYRNLMNGHLNGIAYYAKVAILLYFALIHIYLI